MSRPSNEPYDEHMYTFVVLDADMLRFLAESLGRTIRHSLKRMWQRSKPIRICARAREW